MSNAFSKALTSAAKTLGLSFLVASCVSTENIPANEAPKIDPNAQYERQNSPFSAPITPKKSEKETEGKKIDTLKTDHDGFEL